jgi:hypothetical protein
MIVVIIITHNVKDTMAKCIKKMSDILSFPALFIGVYLTNSEDSDYNKTECIYAHAGEAASASAWIL